MALTDDQMILTKPFAEWPSHLRRAYLEGWHRAKLGVGQTVRDAMALAGPSNAAAILAGAAWQIGHDEARAQGGAS